MDRSRSSMSWVKKLTSDEKVFHWQSVFVDGNSAFGFVRARLCAGRAGNSGEPGERGALAIPSVRVGDFILEREGTLQCSSVRSPQ